MADAPVPSAPARDTASLPERLYPPMPKAWIGWVCALVVTAIGGAIRFVDLWRPHAIMFDETYYAKEALSMLRYGYEQSTVKDANDIILNSNGDWRTLDVFTNNPEFVVHPPFGKWTIAVGEWLFGATPFGFRFSVAVLGTLSIFVLYMIVRRMTRSDLIATFAALFLALDGVAIVMSRTSLLDNVLAFWALAGFGFLVLDRDLTRKRLAKIVRLRGLDAVCAGLGPSLGWRPFRWLAGISLGLACGVKWSGIWFVAVFAIMTVLWDVGTRRMIGVRHPFWVSVLRSAPPVFIGIVVLAFATYLATWTGWFVTDGGWGRTWADNQPHTWIPSALVSLWHYHVEAYNFSIHLTSPHSYQSNPLSWLLQTRPVSFFYETYPNGQGSCTGSNCAAEVLAVGNIVVWWGGTIALLHQTWRWISRRDWRSGAILAGMVGGWVSWCLFLDRTIFSFYAVAFVPFVAMALAMSCGSILGPAPAVIDGIQQPASRRRLWGAVGVGAILLLTVIAAWWWYPIWTGEPLPQPLLVLRIWMPTWV